MPGILFQETQYPHVWVLGFLAAVLFLPLASVMQGGAAPVSALFPAAVVLGISLLFFPMATIVDASAVLVQFGCFKLLRWRFPLREIEDCRVVTYKPLRTYLGWGIRRGFDRSRALTMKGEKAVRLQLRGGRVQLIGSQRAEELAQAVEEGRNA